MAYSRTRGQEKRLFIHFSFFSPFMPRCHYFYFCIGILWLSSMVSILYFFSEDVFLGGKNQHIFGPWQSLLSSYESLVQDRETSKGMIMLIWNWRFFSCVSFTKIYNFLVSLAWRLVSFVMTRKWMRLCKWTLFHHDTSRQRQQDKQATIHFISFLQFIITSPSISQFFLSGASSSNLLNFCRRIGETILFQGKLFWCSPCL